LSGQGIDRIFRRHPQEAASWLENPEPEVRQAARERLQQSHSTPENSA